MTQRAALAMVVTLTITLAGPALAVGVDTFPGPLERGGVPSKLVPGRALLQLRGIDGARLELPRANDVVAMGALKDLGARTDTHLEVVRALVLGWVLVEVRDRNDVTRMPSERETFAMIERLAGDRMVSAAAADHWYTKLMLPNDPGINQMWHLEAIGAPSAWDVTRGTSSQRIGVVDTGLLRSHEDVGGRAVTGFDFVSSSSQANDGNGRDSNFNDAGDSCQGEPHSFHGTHVAGTIGAAANNGIGVAGVNWNAGLVIARALGRCGGASSDIMEGAAWLAGAQVNGVPAIGANKVSVMNLSLGGANACSSFEQQVVDFVDQQGVIFVAAAGNDAGPVGSPANCGKVVTVASFGPDGSKAAYSSFGSQVEIVAPGGDQRFGSDAGVLSASGPDANDYRFQQGTSMAAPHVAGAISLLQAVNSGLSRADIVAALQSGGQSCAGCSGKPMLNLPAALTAVGASATTPPPSSPPPSSPPATPPASSDDIYEQNDSLAQSTNASCGVDTSSLVAAAGDRDVFTFVPPANRQIAVAISAQNGADLDLYVVNGQGSILARSETSTGNERITGTASGTRLFVLVNPYVNPNSGARASGPYRLTITCGATASAAPADGEDAGSDVVDLAPGDGTEEIEDEIVEGEIGGGIDGSDDESAIEDEVVIGGNDIASRKNEMARVTKPLGPSAEGGCTASGAQPLALGALALLPLLLRTRRRHH
jgi:serine protease